MKLITVLLAEDHTILREGVRALLENESDIEIVGEAETGHQAVKLTRKLRPAVVLMDISMPVLNGLEATRQIRKDFPETKVLILSALSADVYIEQVAELGASGFLLKHTSSEDLATAIREVANGNTFFSPAFSRRLRQRQQNSRDRRGNFKQKTNRLSSREIEVLQLIAEGKPNKQVAVELGLTFKTVDKYRQSLMSKLDIHEVAGLTRYAIAEGIIEGDGRLMITS
jgi:DNA-binding NarL/FixJ family response regulator